MNLSFSNFLGEMVKNPVLIIITILINSLIFFNGWSDVPNALTTSVTTRSITPNKGIFLAGVFNFLGIFVMAIFGTNVAETIYKIVNFGNNTSDALLALCAALVAIVLWSLVTWILGIPTSQNHALVASLTGSAIAINNGFKGISLEQWKKVLFGLVMATLIGFLFGFIISKIIRKLCSNFDKEQASPFFKRTQLLGDMAMIFMNGFQDGQKLLALLIMGVLLGNGIPSVDNFTMPFWMLFMCATVMTIGTCIGAKKIIKSVGMKMTNVETYQGTAADVASFSCMIVATLFGIPESSNQTKTAAMMGVSAEKRISSVNWGIAKNIILTWIITFPGCGILGFLITKIILKIF